MVVLLHEGIAQRALLTCLDVEQNLVSRHLADYVQATPKPDLVVFLDLEPSVAVTRHLTRLRESDKYPHRFDLEPESLMTAMHTSDRLLRDVLSVMEAQYGVIVSKVNALDRPSSRRGLQEAILPQIEHLVRIG